MPQLIVNANAPQVKITIDVDFRYLPEQIKMHVSHPVPLSVVAKQLTQCLGTVLDELLKAEAKAAGYVAPQDEQKPPDLPPAPAAN